MDLKELSLVNPDEHWYYQSKLLAIKNAASRFAPKARDYVDVGAGSGFFGRRVPDFALGASTICVDPNYSEESDELDGALRFRRNAPLLPADVYLLIDVLEHVESERALLDDYTKVAISGAIFIVTVPAFRSMWSGHDIFLGHFRRYLLKEVVGVLRDSGLEILHGRYLFGSIFPLAWIARRFQRGETERSSMRPAPHAVNWVLRLLTSLEHRLPFNRVAGLSAMVVARKP